MPRKKKPVESTEVIKEEIKEFVAEEKKAPSPYFKAYKGKAYLFTEALREMGENADYQRRKDIYKANGFTNYLGLGNQNKQMLDLLKEGKLLKA